MLPQQSRRSSCMPCCSSRAPCEAQLPPLMATCALPRPVQEPHQPQGHAAGAGGPVLWQRGVHIHQRKCDMRRRACRAGCCVCCATRILKLAEEECTFINAGSSTAWGRDAAARCCVQPMACVRSLSFVQPKPKARLRPLHNGCRCPRCSCFRQKFSSHPACAPFTSERSSRLRDGQQGSAAAASVAPDSPGA